MKKPERSCVVCKNVIDKKNLIRIVKSVDGSITLDPTGKKNGRGAYLCNNLTCLEKLKMQKGLERSFKMSISSDVYDAIIEEVKLIRKGNNG